MRRVVMKRPPTDYELLRAIHRRHLADYADDGESRETKIAVPIDIPAIASDLGSDADAVFGRLYYHLSPQYEHSNADGSRKRLFMQRAGNAANCINFPLLEAVLVRKRQERRRDFWTAASFVVAMGSVMVSIVALAT
jgi:hypothetical protein